MATRSWLFVPGDSERKLAKVAGCGADVVILDLEDAVAAEAKAQARIMARQWLETHPQQSPNSSAFQRWVRINPLDGELWQADLASVMPARPDGIILPKAAGPDQLRTLRGELFEHEQANGIEPGSTEIMPLVSETAKAALTIPSYAETQWTRLAGLTWGAEDLSAAIGATRKRGEDGQWTDLFRMVRSNVLLTAHACGITPVDTLYADFRDLDGLKAVAEASYADGFAGMLAIHPDQVPIINAAYSPSEAQIAEARAIVELFAENPGEGALQLNGRMVDLPHLEQAQELLASLV